jgi:acyl-CoA synthetase (AMP-forming)/AMP-acid ligase II
MSVAGILPRIGCDAERPTNTAGRKHYSLGAKDFETSALAANIGKAPELISKVGGLLNMAGSVLGKSDLTRAAEKFRAGADTIKRMANFSFDQLNVDIAHRPGESATQIKNFSVISPDLRLLDHLIARTEEDGRLALRGDALLTGYAIEGRGFVDPKVDGWFVADDRVELEGARLRVLGRSGDFIKIGGESVDLARLDAILAEIAGPEAAIVPMPDARLGHVIHLAATRDGDEIVEAFNGKVLPVAVTTP